AGQLPNEILTAIFEDLPPTVLTRLARVCRGWRAAAERLLYASIIIYESLSTPPDPKLSVQAPMPAATVRCCTTLASRRDLAQAVRRFHLRWAAEHVHPPGLLLALAQNIITALLPTLVHLESLELFLGLGSHQPPLASLLASCAFPYLRALALAGLRGAPEPVLHRHPGLLHLRLPDYAVPLQLAPADLPLLTSFRGTPAAAASLLPGRPVRMLGLVGHEFVTERDLARIGGARVRALDLSGMSVLPVLLRDVSRHMADVQVLRVRLALRHTLHYAMSGIVRLPSRLLYRLLEGLTTVLGAFRALQTLDLSPTNAVDGVGGSSAGEEGKLCVSWVGACPTLRRVIFPSKTEWARTDDGRWRHS
ncbi:hypothetical protein K488DRAFT_58912, partial [Vararia minispora EC-137]